MLLLCCLSGFASDIRLTPAPKRLEVTGEPVSFTKEWRIQGDCGAARWLAADLPEKFGWNVTGKGGHVIEFKTVSTENPEEYILEVEPTGVVLSASSEAGFFRAAGRLFNLLSCSSVTFPESGNMMIPRVKITDTPDFPVRIMDLTMAFYEPYSNQARVLATRKIIDILASHGFNAVVIELGGNYVSKHFKSRYPTPWSRADIAGIVRYANSRGVTAIPGINTIGHLERAPYICPLKDGAGKEIGHDIRNRDFFRQYAAVLDELIELFDNPPYVRVGGDESTAVFETLGGTPEECANLFAGTMNFVAEHLRKHSSRAIVWHDMLLSPLLGGNPSSGTLSTLVLSKLSKTIILDYWKYSVAEKYDGIDQLQKAGFEVWASTWNTPQAISRLAKYAHARGVTGFNGTTWCNNHTKGEAMILVGECAWNADAGIDFNAGRVFLNNWNFIGNFANAPGARPLKFSGGVEMLHTAGGDARLRNLKLDLSRPVAAGKTRITALPNPAAAAGISEKNPAAWILMRNRNWNNFMMRIPIVNGPRTYGSIALYTPSHGASTGQGKWGEDWIVKSGKVVDHSIHIPDVKIPKDGVVISAHTTGADVHNNCLKIMELHGGLEFFAVAADTQAPVSLSARPDPRASEIVLLFGAAWSIYTGESQPVATVEVKYENGTADQFILRNDFCLYPDPAIYPNFRTISPMDGFDRNAADRLAVAWKRSSAAEIKEVTITVSPLGAMMQLVLLSAVEM